MTWWQMILVMITTAAILLIAHWRFESSESECYSVYIENWGQLHDVNRQELTSSGPPVIVYEPKPVPNPE